MVSGSFLVGLSASVVHETTRHLQPMASHSHSSRGTGEWAPTITFPTPQSALTLPAPCGTHFIERRKRRQRAVYPHHIGEKEWNSHARTKEKVLPRELRPTGWECKQCFPCLEAPTRPQHSRGRGGGLREGRRKEGGSVGLVTARQA